MNRTVAVDETLIVHENKTQVWLAGAIDTSSKAVRIDIIPNRNQQTLKIFIQNHIIPGTHIAHDSWGGYSFLDEEDSVWTLERHTHGYGDLGYGLNSTSHIEQFLGQIKSIIKKIYFIIPKTDIIYYVKEEEFRCYISKKIVTEQEKIIFNLFKEVFDICS